MTIINPQTYFFSLSLMSRETFVSRKTSMCTYWWIFSSTYYSLGVGVHLSWIHQLCQIIQLHPNYGSNTVAHMFSIQNRPKTKYFYHSFLGAYIKPSDPTENVCFPPYIAVIFALSLCTVPPNLCEFCIRIKVQVTSFYMQWCVWFIQMLL